MKTTTTETTITTKKVRETVLIDRITRILDGQTAQTKARILGYVSSGVHEEIDQWHRNEMAKRINSEVGPMGPRAQS